MNNIFTSKKQYNKVSKLVSETFDIKESKVSHKIAKKLGYKNANAVLASIKDANASKPLNSHLRSMNFIDEKVLIQLTSFNKLILVKNTESQLNRLQITSPIFIQMMFDNYVITDSSFLNKKISLPQAMKQEQTESLNNDSISFYNQKFIDPEDRYNQEYFISTIQHIITGYIYNLEELVNFSKEQLSELLHYCSIEQYNLITTDLDFTEKQDMDVKYEMSRKYIMEMIKYTNKYDDWYLRTFDTSLDFLKTLLEKTKVYTKELATLEYIELGIPPKNSLDLYDINELCYEESVIEHLSDFTYGISSRQEHYLAECFQEMKNKQKNEWDDIDFAISKHLNYVAKEGLTMLRFYEDGKESYIANDLLVILEYAHLIELENRLYNEILSFSSFDDIYLENPENLQYNRYHNENFLNKEVEESYNWYNRSIFTWFINSTTSLYEILQSRDVSENYIAQLEYHLRNVDDVLLDDYFSSDIVEEGFKYFEQETLKSAYERLSPMKERYNKNKKFIDEQKMKIKNSNTNREAIKEIIKLNKHFLK